MLTHPAPCIWNEGPYTAVFTAHLQVYYTSFPLFCTEGGKAGDEKTDLLFTRAGVWNENFRTGAFLCPAGSVPLHLQPAGQNSENSQLGLAGRFRDSPDGTLRIFKPRLPKRWEPQARKTLCVRAEGSGGTPPGFLFPAGGGECRAERVKRNLHFKGRLKAGLPLCRSP